MNFRTLLLSLTLICGLNVQSQPNVCDAQALFIFNFLRHINWPANAVGDKYLIGVIGESDTYNSLKKFTANHKVGNKSLEVVKFNSIESISKCEVLFVSKSKSSKVAEIVKSLGNMNCLVISESQGTNQYGSAIEFFLENDKLRFRINSSNAGKHNLVISKTLIDMSV